MLAAREALCLLEVAKLSFRQIITLLVSQKLRYGIDPPLVTINVNSKS